MGQGDPSGKHQGGLTAASVSPQYSIVSVSRDVPFALRQLTGAKRRCGSKAAATDKGDRVRFAPKEADNRRPGRSQGHVWTAPTVLGEFDVLRSVRVQPCIRPVFAWRLAPLQILVALFRDRPKLLFAAGRNLDAVRAQSRPQSHDLIEKPSGPGQWPQWRSRLQCQSQGWS